MDNNERLKRCRTDLYDAFIQQLEEKNQQIKELKKTVKMITENNHKINSYKIP